MSTTTTASSPRAGSFSTGKPSYGPDPERPTLTPSAAQIQDAWSVGPTRTRSCGTTRAARARRSALVICISVSPTGECRPESPEKKNPPVAGGIHILGTKLGLQGRPLVRIAELHDLHLQAVHHRQEEAVERLALHLQEAAARDRAAALAGEQDGQVVVVVAVAVGQRAAVDDHGVVEDRALLLLDRLQLLEEAGEELDVVLVDLLDLLELVLVARVVGQRVVAFRDAEGREGPVAARVREHEGGDAGRVRLERGREDGAEHLDVLAVVGGGAGGELDVRGRVGGHLLGALDLLLDRADALEVLVELALVAEAEAGAQALGVLVDHVEDGARVGGLAGDLRLGGAGLRVA